MNYTYKLYIPNNGDNKLSSVIEYGGYKEFSWDLTEFSKESLKLKSDWHKKSFFRTKEWLKENHPELLL